MSVLQPTFSCGLEGRADDTAPKVYSPHLVGQSHLDGPSCQLVCAVKMACGAITSMSCDFANFSSCLGERLDGAGCASRFRRPEGRGKLAGDKYRLYACLSPIRAVGICSVLCRLCP
jgi:hypothetical protein